MSGEAQSSHGLCISRISQISSFLSPWLHPSAVHFPHYILQSLSSESSSVCTSHICISSLSHLFIISFLLAGTPLAILSISSQHGQRVRHWSPGSLNTAKYLHRKIISRLDLMSSGRKSRRVQCSKRKGKSKRMKQSTTGRASWPHSALTHTWRCTSEMNYFHSTEF